MAKSVSEEPLEAFKKIDNIAPRWRLNLESWGIDLSGSTVSEMRGVGLAMDWLIKFSRSRKGKSMIQNLAQELIDAFNNGSVCEEKR